MNTKIDIRKYILDLGFDVCGFANIERFNNIPEKSNPEFILPGCKTVIVVGKKFLKSSYISKSTVPYTILRNKLSEWIDQMTVVISNEIEKHDELALPTGAIEPCNWNAKLEKTTGLISLKYAAVQAGLGVVGKNTLLISPNYGNYLWLGAILTTMEIEQDNLISVNPCKEKCNICIKACPVNAIDGSLFMNQEKCWNHAFGEPEEGVEWRIKCFNCRKLCPYSNGYNCSR